MWSRGSAGAAPETPPCLSLVRDLSFGRQLGWAVSCIHHFAVKLHLSLVQYYLGSGSPLGGDESQHMGVTEWSQELSALRRGLKRAPPALRCGPGTCPVEAELNGR